MGVDFVDDGESRLSGHDVGDRFTVKSFGTFVVLAENLSLVFSCETRRVRVIFYYTLLV